MGYSRKNLMGKIVRKVIELNETNDFSLIIDRGTYSLWNRDNQMWINQCTKITPQNLEKTLEELNRLSKFI